MIHSAREIVENRHEGGPVIDFVQGSAEKLDFLPNDSTDLVMAGTFFLTLSAFTIEFASSSSSSRSLVRLADDVARARARHAQGCNGRFLGSLSPPHVLTSTDDRPTDLLRIQATPIPHVDAAHRRVRPGHRSRDLPRSVLATTRTDDPDRPSRRYTRSKRRRSWYDV